MICSQGLHTFLHVPYFSPTLQVRPLRRASAIEVKDLPTPMAGPPPSVLTELAPVAEPEPDSPSEVFDVEPAELPPPEPPQPPPPPEPPIVPVRRFYPPPVPAPESSHETPDPVDETASAEAKPPLKRGFSRQESMGKVGRQNTLAIEMGRQHTLPTAAEERGSQDSLLMPTETMC